MYKNTLGGLDQVAKRGKFQILLQMAEDTVRINYKECCTIKIICGYVDSGTVSQACIIYVPSANQENVDQPWPSHPIEFTSPKSMAGSSE